MVVFPCLARVEIWLAKALTAARLASEYPAIVAYQGNDNFDHSQETICTWMYSLAET